MLSIAIAMSLVLHGLVHLLYFGQSARYFELQPGMAWPDGAWAFSRLLGDQTTRTMANLLLILAAIALVAAGAGILVRQAWWRPLVLIAAAFSSVIYLLFWDGTFQHLDDKGAVGILINLAILAALLIFHWPNFEF